MGKKPAPEGAIEFERITVSLKCDSQDLALHTVMSDGVPNRLTLSLSYMKNQCEAILPL